MTRRVCAEQAADDEVGRRESQAHWDSREPCTCPACAYLPVPPP